jgi:hypothetical protein
MGHSPPYKPVLQGWVRLNQNFKIELEPIQVLLSTKNVRTKLITCWTRRP